MAITSQIKAKSIIGETVIVSWQDAGLLKPSAIKQVITTIEKNLVIKTLGHLKDEDLQTLRVNLKKILG